MSSPGAPSARLVGVVPCLPWPLSVWSWWTRPVRAERLAALRIGIAFFLLLDITFTYGWRLHDLFGPESLGSPELFGWRSDSPRLSWSLLRGVGDPLVSFLSLATLVISTPWIVLHLVTDAVRSSREFEPSRGRLGVSLLLWGMAACLVTIGVWARIVAAGEGDPLAWGVPATLAGVATLFLFLEAIRCYRDDSPTAPRYGRRLVLLLVLTLVLAAAGYGISLAESFDETSLWVRLLKPWQQERELLRLGLALWLLSALLLLVGFATPLASLATWALTLSFANLNSHIDNAGDTMRGIILFYLVFCPCGAVWSFDHWWRRRGQPREVVWVPPWALRLLFVQMILIYFCNGVYKLLGEAWLSGNSLYYVMGDLTLTRFSLAEQPLSPEVMRLLTWSVLIWETSFPLMILWRPTRIMALLFGVSFHLGIYATMELGFFVPYALCLYLPLVPWGELADWLRRRGEPALVPVPTPELTKV